MTPGNQEEKKRPNCGERQGTVFGVMPDFYIVRLYTLVGWRYYKFPKHFSNDILQKDDLVKCYVVEIARKLKPRLEKIPKKVFTEEEIEKIERKFTKLADKELKRIEKNLNKLKEL